MDDLYWPFPTAAVSEWPGGMSDVRMGVHKGTDFAVAQGTPLRATTSGTIRVYNGATGGWGVDIVRPDGWVVRNWHLSEFRVTAGQRVNSGDIIGLTGGAKGHPGAGTSTGPHLHWEIRSNTGWGDGWVDPRPLNPATFGSKPQPQTITEAEENMYIRNSKTGAIALFGPDAGNGVHVFADVNEYNAWRGVIIGYNSVTEERFKKQTPPDAGSERNFLNVDEVGWRVAVGVSASLELMNVSNAFLGR